MSINVSHNTLHHRQAKILVINPYPALFDHFIVIFKYLATRLPLLVLPILRLWAFYSKGDKPLGVFSNKLITQNRKGIALIILTPFILTILQSVITGQKVIGR